MRKLVIVLLVSMLIVPALTATAADVTAPIHQFIDSFNKGDANSAFATYASGDIMIVDEFAPFSWSGPNAPRAWAADLEKEMKGEGSTEGQVKYGAPTRTEIMGDRAYVILPTSFVYRLKSKPMVEKGQMTFVLSSQGGDWKIAAWTWTGEKAHSPK